MLLVAPASGLAQQALPVTARPFFSSTLQTARYTIDLGTLPTRPAFVVEASPPLFRSDMRLEIRVTNFAFAGFPGPGNCPAPPPIGTFTSPAVAGPNSVEVPLWDCDPAPAAFVGDTAEVEVQVLDFGGGRTSAFVDVSIRGATVVPSGTDLVEFDPTTASQTLRFDASKDTVLYASDTSRSNGAGEFLWAGVDFTPPIPPDFVFDFDQLRSLIGFELGAVPETAIVDEAELRLDVVSIFGPGNDVGLYRVTPDPTAGPWAEGNADAAGNEFFGATGTTTAADWLRRRAPIDPWMSPGGGPLGSPLAVLTLGTFPPGPVTFSGPSLTAAVGDMVATDTADEGFLLANASPGFVTVDRGIQFASRDAGAGVLSPQLTVVFTPTDPYQVESAPTGVVSFVGEGEDFRWIYDTDGDDVLGTSIGGVCTVLEDAPNSVPYSYQYLGTPGYVGLDCCTWQIDSPQSGTIGTGQAIFFHGLDPTNPANLPPDGDGDGIFDVCDNCLIAANGPQRGTCLAGPQAGQTCQSIEECDGHPCSLSQEDVDFDFVGDACPEPDGPAPWIVSALTLLSLRRGRLRPSRTHGKATPRLV